MLGLDPNGSRRERRELAGRMGVMLQDGGIYPGARPIDVVAQYLAIHRRPGVAQPGAGELIEKVGLGDRRRTTYRRLSGGERQRLSLALALAAQPEIIFLDEPTSGVDVNGRAMIRGIIRDLAAQGCTVVLATHELDEAERVCDRVVIFDRGRVLVDGALDDVRKARRGVHLRTVRPLDFSRMPEVLADQLVENSPGDYSVEEAPQSYIATLAVWLSEQGVEVIEMRTGLASLEEVFRTLTTEDRA